MQKHSGTSNGTGNRFHWLVTSNGEATSRYRRYKHKLLLLTFGKTESILESGKVPAIKRHREALSTIAKQIDTLKLQVVEERFKASDSKEDIAKWSQEIKQQVTQVDTQVTKYKWALG